MKHLTLLTVLLIVALSLSACTVTDTNTEASTNPESDPSSTQPAEPDIAPGPDENGDPNNDDTQTPAMERDNSGAELTTLFSGTFTVGDDVPPGRYVISGTGSGNLFIYDESGYPDVNEILDDGSSGFDIGVSSVTVDIEDGQEIEISGINEVVFTPAVTVMSNTLGAGTWVVGLDIEAGKYDVEGPEDASGNFFVYDGSSFPVVNEILDRTEFGFGVEKVRVTLEAGQVIKISGIENVTFTEA